MASKKEKQMEKQKNSMIKKNNKLSDFINASLDKLYSYIGHQLYSRLKSFNQEVMESKIHLDEEKIIEQLKKPNPNESLFKDDSTLKPIFEQMEETLSIKFIL